MNLAEKIYQRSLTLPEDDARAALDFIEFLQQRRAPNISSDEDIKKKQEAALNHIAAVKVHWHNKPMVDRDAFYDEAR